MADLAHKAAPDDASDRLIALGRIVAAHGLQGWVKVQPYSQPHSQPNPAQDTVLLRVKKWWLGVERGPEHGAEPVTVFTVKTARLQGSTVIAQLQDVADRDQAEALRGLSVFAPRSAFPVPDADEYYWVDLVGCLLYGQGDDADSPVLLGRVEDVSDNGAHALLKVARLTQQNDGTAFFPVHDAKGRSVELLVPFVAAHVHSVDLAARRIDTNWPVDF